MTSGSSTPDRAAAITATLRRLCGLIGVCWSLMTIQIVGWVLILARSNWQRVVNNIIELQL